MVKSNQLSTKNFGSKSPWNSYKSDGTNLRLFYKALLTEWRIETCIFKFNRITLPQKAEKVRGNKLDSNLSLHLVWNYYVAESVCVFLRWCLSNSNAIFLCLRQPKFINLTFKFSNIVYKVFCKVFVKVWPVEAVPNVLVWPTHSRNSGELTQFWSPVGEKFFFLLKMLENADQFQLFFISDAAKVGFKEIVSLCG